MEIGPDQNDMMRLTFYGVLGGKRLDMGISDYDHQMVAGQMPDKDETSYFDSPFLYFYGVQGRDIRMKLDVDHRNRPRIHLFDQEKNKGMDVKVK